MFQLGTSTIMLLFIPSSGISIESGGEKGPVPMLVPAATTHMYS